MSAENTQKHRRWDIRRLPMDIARLVCVPLLLLFRMKRLTPEGERYTEKLRGGAIVAANHTAFSDPFVVGVAFWYRRMFFLVAETVMQGWLRSRLLKGVGAVRIDRNGTDIEAIQASVKLLRQGYLLTVFPQGGISKEDDVDSIKSGAVLMAMKAGVPIVPMHIRPRTHWYERKTVVIGKTVDPRDYCQKKMPSTADIRLVTEALAEEMRRCKKADETFECSEETV